ncbi:MAG: serine protease [Bacteroidales bacterium]|nr:serine protease [Bacteroidales bacterium]
MPTWDEILGEMGSRPNVFDSVRRKYLAELSAYTNRNTIVYYSGFLQKAESKRGVDFGINDFDKNGFMTVINKLDRSRGLDLILHTPGGNIASTESIVHYLKSMFGNDIRAIVPQIAMSAGTMISCACKSIVMGKQSNLGPIDPQIFTIPARGLLEEVEHIKEEVAKNPSSIIVWREILQKYHPTMIGESEKAIKWAENLVSEWLSENMFANESDKWEKVEAAVAFLGDHETTLSHSRHLHIPDLKGIGLHIEEMEADQTLQNKILSVHHATIISITQTKAIKIIENNLGKAFIQSV